jgi:hypothetical protein
MSIATAILFGLLTGLGIILLLAWIYHLSSSLESTSTVAEKMKPGQ